MKISWFGLGVLLRKIYYPNLPHITPNIHFFSWNLLKIFSKCRVGEGYSGGEVGLAIDYIVEHNPKTILKNVPRLTNYFSLWSFSKKQ